MKGKPVSVNSLRTKTARFRPDGWFPYAMIVFVWFLFSIPYFIKGLVPFPSKYLVSFFPPWNASYAMPVKNNAMPDVITQIYPWKKLTVETWKTGNVPLWNPYSFSGTVHAANYQSAVFTPFNLLFFVLPFIDAWSHFILLQPLLAGLFAVLYARKIGISEPGAAVSGLAFMFSGFMVSWMAYGTLGYAVLYLPFILYMIERLRDGWRFAPLGISLAVALSFFSGHFQISLYVFSAAVLYCLFASPAEGKDRNRMTGESILYLLLGLAVASVQLLPTLEAYSLSSRAASFVKGEIIPWRYIVTLFAPDYFGNPVTRNDWYGHYAEWNGYAGVIPLFFSLAAAFFVKDRRKTYFSLLAVASLLLSYASPVTDLLFFLRIPVISTSAASRIMSLLTFAVPVLSGIGYDGVIALAKAGDRKRLIRIILLVSMITVFSWLATFFPSVLTGAQVTIARRNLILPSALAVVFISGLAVVIIRQKFVYAVMLLCILFTGLDLYRFAAKWMPFDPREFVYPETALTTFLEKTAGTDRVFGNFGNELTGMFSLQSIEGYDAMYDNRYGQFLHAASNGIPAKGDRSVALLDKRGKYTRDAVKLLGVRYFVQRKSDGRNVWAFPVWEYGDRMRKIYDDDTYEVFEYLDSYPRAFMASSYVLATSSDAAATLMFDKKKGIDLSKTLVLEDQPVPAPAVGNGYAEITTYLPNEVTIRTDSAVPKLLFLSDAYHPGWVVTVDGRKETLLKADFDFRAVALPAGRHLVRFQYMPRSFLYGVWVFVGSLIVLIILEIRRHGPRLR